MKRRYDGIMMAFALFVVGLGLFMVAMNAGCSLFESACTKALPAISTATVLLDDAQTKVDQAEAIVVRIADQATRDKALAVVAELRSGLVAAETALHASSEACTAPDVSTAFAAFIAAWPKIVPFISLLGGPGAGTQVGTPLVISR